MSKISGICLFLVTHLNHELTRTVYELRVSLARALSSLSLIRMASGYTDNLSLPFFLYACKTEPFDWKNASAFLEIQMLFQKYLLLFCWCTNQGSRLSGNVKYQMLKKSCAAVTFKVIPLKLFYYQTFLETWHN